MRYRGIVLLALMLLALSVLAPTTLAATTVARYSCVSYPAPCAFTLPEMAVDGRQIASGSVRAALNVGQSRHEQYDFTQTFMGSGPNGGIRGWITVRHIDEHNKYLIVFHGVGARTVLQFQSDRAGKTITLFSAPFEWDAAHPHAHLRLVADGFHFALYALGAPSSVASPRLLWQGNDPQQAVAQGGNIILYTDAREVVCWEDFTGILLV